MQRTPKAGFTLIEVMVVIAIIGTVILFAALALNAFLRGRHVSQTAQLLTIYLRVAERQAILQPAVIGVTLSTNHYAFYQFIASPKTGTRHWQLIKRNSLLKMQRIANNVTVRMTTAHPAEKHIPQIVLLPNGMLSAFKIFIGEKNKPSTYIIIGQQNGIIQLQTA